MTEIQAVFEFFRGGGAMAVVLVVAYGLLTGKLRLGREVDRAEEDRVFYRDTLLPILERQQEVLEELKRDAYRNTRG